MIALFFLPTQTLPQHRLRYQLLADRRRALHEHQRLSGRILEANPALQGRLAMRRQRLEKQLCTCPSQSDVQQLQHDIDTLYAELVYLAKLWQPLYHTVEVRSAS